MVWPVQTHPAQSTGPESKRNSGDGEYFSLDFSFYRTALLEKWTAEVKMHRQRWHFSGTRTSRPECQSVLMKSKYSRLLG